MHLPWTGPCIAACPGKLLIIVVLLPLKLIIQSLNVCRIVNSLLFGQWQPVLLLQMTHDSLEQYINIKMNTIGKC